MTVFYSFLPTTVHTGAPAHDGLGRAALVRRFKSLKPSHKAQEVRVVCWLHALLSAKNLLLGIHESHTDEQK